MLNESICEIHFAIMMILMEISVWQRRSKCLKCYTYQNSEKSRVTEIVLRPTNAAFSICVNISAPLFGNSLPLASSTICFVAARRSESRHTLCWSCLYRYLCLFSSRSNNLGHDIWGRYWPMDSLGDPADMAGIAKRQIKAFGMPPDRWDCYGAICTDFAGLPTFDTVCAHPTRQCNFRCSALGYHKHHQSHKVFVCLWYRCQACPWKVRFLFW